MRSMRAPIHQRALGKPIGAKVVALRTVLGDRPQASNTLRQGILDQPAAAHDQRQMGALILEQAQIL